MILGGYSSSRHHRPPARIYGSREGVRASWGWQKLPRRFFGPAASPTIPIRSGTGRARVPSTSRWAIPGERAERRKALIYWGFEHFWWSKATIPVTEVG